MFISDALVKNSGLKAPMTILIRMKLKFRQIVVTKSSTIMTHLKKNKKKNKGNSSTEPLAQRTCCLKEGKIVFFYSVAQYNIK